VAESLIDDASRLVDSYLAAAGEPVPLTDDAKIARVRPHAINFLRVWLLERRLIDSDESKAWELQKQSTAFLEKIASGEYKLSTAPVLDTAAVNGSGWYSFTPEFDKARSV
jgi:phage gp36-like protein